MLNKEIIIQYLNNNRIIPLLLKYCEYKGKQVPKVEIAKLMVRDRNRMVYMIEQLLEEFKIQLVTTKEGDKFYV